MTNYNEEKVPSSFKNIRSENSPVHKILQSRSECMSNIIQDSSQPNRNQLLLTFDP